MKNTHIIQSKPIDGRYDNTSLTCKIGSGDPEYLPTIEPDKYGPGFPGGLFPSGHNEIYHDTSDHLGWYTETLPMPRHNAEKKLAERQKKSDPNTIIYKLTNITNNS